MIIIISPTKQMKMKEKQETNAVPVFVKESKKIVEVLKNLTIEDIQKLMKVNEKIAKENLLRYQSIAFDQHGSCAIHTYHGLQFQYMQLETDEQLAYVQQYVRILSGLYGVVRPMDSIYPYRLEMQAPLSIGSVKHIYDFWGNQLANELTRELVSHEEPYILNLASKEYEKAVLPYIDNNQVIHIMFKLNRNGNLKTESTQVKMARGRMIHYLSLHQIVKLKDVKLFHEDGYQFKEELSDVTHYVFVKEA